jgi:hypothetical protein
VFGVSYALKTSASSARESNVLSTPQHVTLWVAAREHGFGYQLSGIAALHNFNHNSSGSRKGVENSFRRSERVVRKQRQGDWTVD